MRDLFGCQSFSEGTLANFGADCSRRLEPVEAIIREQIAASTVAGFDETGMRAVGSLHWLPREVAFRAQRGHATYRLDPVPDVVLSA